MDVQTLKVQFPDVKFFVFSGRSNGKRIKGQWFPRGIAIPVWDHKAQKLLRNLPYMKQVDENQIAGGDVKKAETAKPVEVPPNWWTLHHKKRVVIAKAISNEDIHSVARADEILAQRVPRPAVTEVVA